MDSKQIEKIIFNIRGSRVMLDSDLAELYEVETKTLVRQVKRNQIRFPDDFMIIPNSNELEDLRCQFGTANRITDWNHMRRTPPMLFTESGVAMLSTVLHSEQAIQINISIIRTFIRLRSFLSLESSTSRRMDHLEAGTNKLFKVVFERMDSYEEALKPRLPSERKKISLKKE